jgi:hypothetical protein
MPDFSPASQDKAAVKKMQGRGILAAAEKGVAGIDEFLQEGSYEWASLPPFRYGGQGTKTNAQVKAYYAERLAFYQAKGGNSFIGSGFTQTKAAAGITDPAPTTSGGGFLNVAFDQTKAAAGMVAQDAAQMPPPLADAAETKPVEVSQKGTEIIIELGYHPAQLIAFHYIHTGTHTRGRMADSTVFEGQSIRWLMTRRTKNATYQSISLRELAERVATAHGLELEMEGTGPKYAHLDQSGITDYELLLRECRAIGYGITDKGRKLILKPRRPEFTGYVIDRQQLISIEFSDKAQKDKQVAPGGSLTSPEVPAAEAKAKQAAKKPKTDQGESEGEA